MSNVKKIVITDNKSRTVELIMTESFAKALCLFLGKTSPADRMQLGLLENEAYCLSSLYEQLNDGLTSF